MTVTIPAAEIVDALADPCEECEARLERRDLIDLAPDYRRDCTVALVECRVCGTQERRDIPTGRPQ